MKTFVRSIIFTSVLALGVSGLQAAQSSGNWMDQYYKAKLGRNSPAVEARLKAERENTAFRAEDTTRAPSVVLTWTERYFKARLGRNTPAVEARLKAERESTAFREEPTREAPARSWSDQWYTRKYGRPPGR
jgi:hypothetical protein